MDTRKKAVELVGAFWEAAASAVSSALWSLELSLGCHIWLPNCPALHSHQQARTHAHAHLQPLFMHGLVWFGFLFFVFFFPRQGS